MATYDEDHTINQCKNIFVVEARLSELKEQVADLKKEVATLRQEIVKKGEEIKDVFYVADMTRARIDEVDEYLRDGIDRLTEVVTKCKAEAEARTEHITHLREEVLQIKELALTKAPKVIYTILKMVAIIFAMLLLLFPRVHQFLDFLSK